MASIYKKPIIIRDPKMGEKSKAQSKKWWGRFCDETGKECRVPLATDKTAAQTMLAALVKKAERRAAGITDPLEDHGKRPLFQHLKDYEKYLRDKGNTEDHVLHTVHRVEAAIKECRFATIRDISASRLQGFLGDLRRQGFGIATSNHYLRAMKMFTRWLVKDRRHRDDVLAYLSMMNAETDRRRLRRPLSPEEFERLIQSTYDGSLIQKLTGQERVLLYIIACYTGFRRNEIGSVTSRSFDFALDPPTLTVQAAYSKRRRVDVIPLRKDFATMISEWIAGRGRLKVDDPLLKIRGKHTAEMLRKDLAWARSIWIGEAKTDAEQAMREKSSFLTYVNAEGRVADFHALRKTFITNLSRGGVSPKMAQSLARHSDINLTMNVYTMLNVCDQAAAVESLPPLPIAATGLHRQPLRATGTEG
jgi:integrase